MSLEPCAQHPETVASYRCQACERALCSDCIEEGHALLFCRLCGEQALPLDASQPATTQQKQRHEAITRPYSLAEAMLYPFRGMGLYLYIGTVVLLVFLGFLVKFSFGCYRFLLYFGLWSLIIGLQFKIVRSTAEGENELPDWPDYADWMERIGDLVKYLFITLLNTGPFVLYLYLGRGQIFTTEPNLLFWAGAAVVAWLGSVLGVMAFGAAGVYGGLETVRIDLHIRGFLAAGADAVHVANLVYALGTAIFLAGAVLNFVPLVGSLVSALTTAYWAFTGPHLSGVLFRRHSGAMAALYSD